MWRSLRPTLSLLALVGCTGQPPTVVRTNGPFVSVTRPTYTHSSAVNEVAQGYCDQFGKRAELLSTLCADPTCPEREYTYVCR